jgi:chromosome segregation ATPase
MLKDGRSFFCEGRIDDFRTMAAIAGFPDVLGSGDDGSALKKSQELNTPPSSQTTHENPTRFKDLKRERSRLEKLVPSLEGRLSTLETQKVSLQHDLATTDSHNYSALAEMQTRIDQLQSQIETAEEQWLQASEELTNISQKLEEIGRG